MKQTHLKNGKKISNHPQQLVPIIMNLKICQFNVENLFVFMDMYSGEDISLMSEDQWQSLAYAQLKFKQKPLFKLNKLAETIKDINPDVLMLCEVGGRESLENFNTHFLNDEYYIGYIQGNSNRFIDVSFLIKRDFPYQFEIKTNKDKIVLIEQYNKIVESKFSRDALELHLYDGDAQSPSLICLLAHLKSQISNNYDPKGEYTRTAEFYALINVFENLKNNHSCPIVVGGDFNFILTKKEKDFLAEVGLLEIHDILGSPLEDRVTHIHFDNDGNPNFGQLDYLLVTTGLSVKKEESFTYRFKDYYGQAYAFPKSIKEKRLNESDHYPLVLSIEIN
jgi:endonuclease/exonuclease/phosphatase family metal-dependent hydrolase